MLPFHPRKACPFDTMPRPNGNDDDYQIFYTALYHVLLSPTTWSDVDGRYIGYDQQIHTVPPGLVGL